MPPNKLLTALSHMGPRNVRQVAEAYVWAVLLVLRWCQMQLLEPIVTWWLDTVMANWEETLKACLREVLAYATRLLNGASNAVVTLLFGRSASSRMRATRARPSPWVDWWASRGRGRTGTFNAILARDGLVPGGERAGADGSVAPGLHPSGRAQRQGCDDGLTRLPPKSGAGTPWRWRWGWWRGRLGRGASASQSGPRAVRTRVQGGERAPRPAHSSGSELFRRPGGSGQSQGAPRRGFMEEGRLNAELALTNTFAWLRTATRQALMLPDPSVTGSGDPGWGPSFNVPGKGDGRPMPRSSSFSHNLRGLSRKPSFNSAEDLQHWTVADAILRAGYPLESHIVTTEDGYILTMQRIPRKDSKEVVFFQHGVMDTSLSWVSNGVEGSQAFAAHDAGFDVWLGNSRSNPPRAHIDPAKSGLRYWYYSINELGIQDMDAQLDFVHRAKTAELARAGRLGHVLGGMGVSGLEQREEEQEQGGPAEGKQHRHGTLGLPRSARSSGPGARRGHRRSGSDSVLAARRNLEQGGAESLENGPEGGPGPGTTEAQAEAASMAPDEGWGPAASCAGGRGQEGGLAQAADSAAAPLAGGREGGAGVRAHHAQTPGTEALEGCSGKHASAFAASQAATPAPGQPRGSTGAPAHPPSGVGGAMKRQVSHDDGVASVQYRLQAVGHSLGGCSLLIYAVHRAMAGRAHHLKRLGLLSPAGYHSHYPRAAWIFLWVLPTFMRVLEWLRPGLSAPVYIPSSLLRYITFKLSLDVQQLPALNELLRAAFRLLLSGDGSEWDRAVQMPHYNQYSMPALSLHTGAHLVQLINERRFRLYDRGSRRANRAAYGVARPPDLAAQYHLLAGLPVDMVAGRQDGIVAAADVHTHYTMLRDAGVRATFKEFDVGHLDVVFAMKDEVQHYVLHRLLLPPAPLGPLA
ncbi:hypothetical protein APUTEX25_005407 [Auxenochlorella protothecoides]|uniref:Partial AB-hydrolase lipase domain-containing protein n=1 Tax=Auxenochlorella protothecoides TaxID=3075 RepID=A0A3M7KYZ1_AUXPR|nr:hypothetical protein APUTEX25_005407 [Auxenochlorella protothecoides]|eukprot:RMZ55129.1 hypothetical protein APUTEX25_005407 [Auxenochlorella protothecoides]